MPLTWRARGLSKQVSKGRTGEVLCLIVAINLRTHSPWP